MRSHIDNGLNKRIKQTARQRNGGDEYHCTHSNTNNGCQRLATAADKMTKSNGEQCLKHGGRPGEGAEKLWYILLSYTFHGKL